MIIVNNNLYSNKVEKEENKIYYKKIYVKSISGIASKNSETSISLEIAYTTKENENEF